MITIRIAVLFSVLALFGGHTLAADEASPVQQESATTASGFTEADKTRFLQLRSKTISYREEIISKIRSGNAEAAIAVVEEMIIANRQLAVEAALLKKAAVGANDVTWAKFADVTLELGKNTEVYGQLTRLLLYRVLEKEINPREPTRNSALEKLLDNHFNVVMKQSKDLLGEQIVISGYGGATTIHQLSLPQKPIVVSVSKQSGVIIPEDQETAFKETIAREVGDVSLGGLTISINIESWAWDNLKWSGLVKKSGGLPLKLNPYKIGIRPKDPGRMVKATASHIAGEAVIQLMASDLSAVK